MHARGVAGDPPDEYSAAAPSDTSGVKPSDLAFAAGIGWTRAQATLDLAAAERRRRADRATGAPPATRFCAPAHVGLERRGRAETRRDVVFSRPVASPDYRASMCW